MCNLNYSLNPCWFLNGDGYQNRVPYQIIPIQYQRNRFYQPMHDEYMEMKYYDERTTHRCTQYSGQTKKFYRFFPFILYTKQKST